MSDEALPAGDEWSTFGPDPEHERPATRRLHPFHVVAIALGVVIAVGLVWLRPTGTARTVSEAGLAAIGVPTDFYRAVVTALDEGPCDFQPDETCRDLTFEMEEGPDVGRTFTQSLAGPTAPDLAVGQRVVMSYRAPNGRVTDARLAPCSFDATQNCEFATIVLTRGSELGRIVEIDTPEGFSTLEVGDEVDVSFDEDGRAVGATPSDPEFRYRFADIERRPVLLIVFVIFAVAVIALGGWRGVTALAGLGTTLIIVLLWLLPAILDGRGAVPVAIVGAIAVAYVALYVSHGFSLMTTVAVLGTAAAILLTTVLSWLTVGAAHFTGFATEESTLLVLFQQIDVRGLLLAGMVLGAAGALDDVTITQASAVWQLRRANPTAPRRELIRHGLEIGRHHIGSTVNTLLLAYLGAALPLAVLFVLSQQSLGSIANSEVVAVEIVRTLVGSVGLIAAVPFTTWLAAIAVPVPRSAAA